MKTNIARSALICFSMICPTLAQAQNALTVLKSSFPYGHPMLLYLKSSKPIPEAHARCLRIVERGIDRLYGYYSSYSIGDDMTLRAKGIASLKTIVNGDWGVPSRQLLIDLKEIAAKRRSKNEMDLANARQELMRETQGVELDAAAIAKRLDAEQYDSYKSAVVGLIDLLDIMAAQKAVANEEAGYTVQESYLEYSKCALQNNLPPTIE